MNEDIKINWYRTKVDKAVMSRLMRKSDAKAFTQVLSQLGLYIVTGTASYLAFWNIHADNWHWTLPVLLLALAVHGSFAHFFGGIACHELCHKTPFKTLFLNEFFISIYAFLAWFDPVAFRVSHVKHHQVTVHEDHDGEVILPTGLNWHGVLFTLKTLTIDPPFLFKLMRTWFGAALGDSSINIYFAKDWMNKIIPETNDKLRRNHRDWARVVVLGHLALAAIFIATGNWILLIIVTFGCQYCAWLEFVCGAPQHIGLVPNSSDFRLCCRTYTCSWFPAFLYWNMQYHVEHHMFPAVPFYNLPELRKAIEHDLPPASHGLWNVWQEILPIMKRQRQDSSYVYTPIVPQHKMDGLGIAPNV